MRIGLLGGSFDPIHYGHLAMAKQATKQLHLDRLIFVLSNDTPLKERKLSNYNDRKAMVKIMIKPFRKFELSTLEEDSDGKNYTIDTICKFKRQYPNNEFYFIIGADQVENLKLWKDIDLLQNEVTLVCFDRYGYSCESPYRLKHLVMPNINVSSTQLRHGNNLQTKPAVLRYYYQSKSFDVTFIADYMSDYRYQHSLRVAHLSREIAIANALDGNKAYLMGIFHDINKENKIINQEAGIKLLQLLQPEVLKLPPGCWHGPLGAYVTNHHFGIKDKDILKAINHHVLGDCHNAYAMVLYCADKLDPNRDYDTKPLIALCKKRLISGYRAVCESQKAFYGEESLNG